MTTAALIQSIVNDSLDRVRLHRFITNAMDGKLNKEQAGRWIKCAGRESRSFPYILQNMISVTTNETVKNILQENLNDELGNGEINHAHFRHYLHLLDEIAVSRDDFFGYHEGPGIKFALSMAYNVSTANNMALALGYMVINEGMTPITYNAARSALMPFYPNLNTRFFDMHIEVDDRHVEELYRAIDCLSEPDLDDVRFGVLAGERGMASLLDEALGLFDFCPDIPVYEAA
jgi:pyrroloquinoline quinone (PQQ) biosynthesis protein C